MKLVMVGGVAGGASAATQARRHSEDATIVVFERGPDVSYNNCGLPYYVGGVIDDREKLLVVTAERMRARYNLDVRARTAVKSIGRAPREARRRDDDADRRGASGARRRTAPGRDRRVVRRG